MKIKLLKHTPDQIIYTVHCFNLLRYVLYIYTSISYCSGTITITKENFTFFRIRSIFIKHQSNIHEFNEV